MPYEVHKLGPGVLKVGAVGAEVDFSCQINHAIVEWDKDKDDDQKVLCGETVPGATTYTATLSGNLFTDIAADDGIVRFSWDHRGESHPFTFTPNTAALTTVTGNVIVDPIAVGGDEMGANMAVDFEWDIVGEPELANTGWTPLVAAEPELVGAE